MPFSNINLIFAAAISGVLLPWGNFLFVNYPCSPTAGFGWWMRKGTSKLQKTTNIKTQSRKRKRQRQEKEEKEEEEKCQGSIYIFYWIWPLVQIS